MNGNRREFGMVLGALAATAMGVPGDTQAKAQAPDMVSREHDLSVRVKALPLIKPHALGSGAVVGLIAPGGVVDDAIIEKSVRNLESVGFAVKLGKNIRAAHGGYAGSVAQRLADLHDMFLDNEVKAIWTARGGSGCTALLPHVRYPLIRAHPKILVGYSDITALHLALYRKAGLVTFHGPAWSTFSDYSVSQMMAVLMSPRPETEINMSVENSRKAIAQSEFALRTLRHGIAEGRLIGGNLSVMSALIGTPFAAPIRNSLLFLEDVSEPPYRIDRMLTQLQQSVGELGQPDGLRLAAGVMLGVFSKVRARDGDASLTLGEVIDEQLGNLPIPTVYGYSFGHVAHQITLPIGVRARLNTAEQTLTLLEPAVRA
ncbi:MAG: LD-carboxypeptidase [Betaproteobacteria bacterium]|nr:LD-carboxypeptidase [Betaproteobacteria bacterium]